MYSALCGDHIHPPANDLSSVV